MKKKKERMIEIIRVCILYPLGFCVFVCLPGLIEMLPMWVAGLIIFCGAITAGVILIKKLREEEEGEKEE